MKKLRMDELNRKGIDEFKQSDKIPVIVVLDNVRSLHNIGSVFRTSDAFLIESIYLCGISSTPPHKEIHKTALGAENTVDWQYFNQTIQAIESLKNNGYAVWGIEQTQNSTSLDVFTVNRDTRYAFIFGNEVRGVDQEIINLCDGCIEIPQFGTKHSFNVSVSAGIVLWECYKQIKSDHLLRK
ncbi:MAG: RNA methyltransferase [Bacteroidales bacterium]|nr:RNA methyltransferase [Bacteroidales bacterium]